MLPVQYVKIRTSRESPPRDSKMAEMQAQACYLLLSFEDIDDLYSSSHECQKSFITLFEKAFEAFRYSRFEEAKILSKVSVDYISC